MNSPDDHRSRAERLIELADQVAAKPVPQPRWKRWLPAVLAVAGVSAGVLGFALAGDDSGDGSTAPTTATGATASTAPATTQPVTTEPVTTEPVTTEPATTAPATTEPATTTTIAWPEPVRWAEFTGGKVYLEGTVPDQATADEVRDKAAAVVGPDNVVVDYDVVPGAPRPPFAPLYVRDSVLFAPNSVEIDDTARGVLDLGVLLMEQNPEVTIDIQGHTDSDGPAEANLELSQFRVDVIFSYLVSQGIDPARLTKAALGETQPIAENATAEGRAKNRRVEFTINNLIG